MFEDLIRFLHENEDKVIGLVPNKPFSFLMSLVTFWSGRNICMQQIAKSGSGEKQMEPLVVLGYERLTSDTGKWLSRKINAWANAYKSSNTKDIKTKPGQ